MGSLKKGFAETWRSVFSLRVMAIVFCAMVFAVFGGPFGTLEEMSLTSRILFWVPVILVSVLIGWFSNIVAQTILNGRSLLWIETLSVVMMTVVFAPFVWVMAGVIRQEPIIGSQGFPTLFFNVFIVVAAVGVIRYAVIRINEDANDSAVTVQKPEPPRLLRRVPKHLRGQVLRLSARNHMVEVVTDLGKTELRLRLTDAVAEMEPVEGLMAHRSHWVAREAVETAYRADTQKVYVKLTNGDVVPISRTFRPDWIEIGALSPCTNGATLPVASVPPVAQDPSEPQLSPRA